MAQRNNTPGQRRIRDGTPHCALCERKLYKLAKRANDNCTIDHFYPLDSGPNLNRGWNKIITCNRCNSIKGNKNPQQFIDYCRKQLTKSGHSVPYVKDLQDIIKNVTAIEETLRDYYLMRDII